MKNITLNNLNYKEGSIKKRKRVGRGKSSNHGKTCGKGNNGAKQRSGYSTRFGFEGGQTPLNRRLPMVRIINKFRKDKSKTVTTDMLARVINKGIKEINYNVLFENRVIGLKENYKIVKGKDDSVKFSGITVEANNFSKEAKALIEKEGGKCNIKVINNEK
jgi:large subunit ribosomal protein L15